MIIDEAVNTSIPIELIEFDRTQKSKNLKPLSDKAGVKYVKDAELKEKTPEKQEEKLPPKDTLPKFKIDKRPTETEIKEKGFQFCDHRLWQPNSEYMKVEHELITLLLSEFKARANQWTNYMTLRNEIKDIKWGTPLKPTLAKWIEVALEILEYQGFLISRNKDSQWMLTEYKLV